MFYRIVLLVGLVGVANCVIPDYIKPCKADDPQISACIIRAIDELRPQLKEGIPELEVPAIDPLKLDVVRLTQGIQFNVTDIEVYGASTFEILELKTNIPKNRFEFTVKLPFLRFRGNYELNSRILVVNLKGKGPIYGNFSDYSFTGVLKGKRIQINGQEHLKFDRMKLVIHSGKTVMKLENLFNGNPTLGAATNDILNESNSAILEVIRPALADSLSFLFTDVANKITLSFTTEELFL